MDRINPLNASSGFESHPLHNNSNKSMFPGNINSIINPQAAAKGSSPTPGALLADSTTSLKYHNKQNKNNRKSKEELSSRSPRIKIRIADDKTTK